MEVGSNMRWTIVDFMGAMNTLGCSLLQPMIFELSRYFNTGQLLGMGIENYAARVAGNA
jgi:hypothetical protein